MKVNEKFIQIQPKGCKPVEFGVYSLVLRDPAGDRADASAPHCAPPDAKNRDASVCLEATYDCNLACRYCFQQTDSQFSAKHGRMEIETAVEYLRRYAPPDAVDNIRVSYMGGEPTLNMDLMVRIVDYCRKTYKRASFSLTTNGTRLAVLLKDAVTLDLNPRLASLTIGQWLVRSGHNITLSLDGPQNIQDSSRINKAGDGSYETIMSGLEQLCAATPQAGQRIAFRATVGEGLDRCSIKQRLIFFNELIDRGLGADIHLEPAALPDCPEAESLAVIAAQFDEAADWVIESVKAGKIPRWSDVIKRPLSRLFYKRPLINSCGAGKKYLVCGVDGTLYACHRTNGAEVGSLKEGYDAEKMAEWADNTVFFQTPCKTCDFRFLCGGNCRSCNLTETGDVRSVSEFSCGVRKARMMAAFKMHQSLTSEQLQSILPAKQAKRKPNG